MGRDNLGKGLGAYVSLALALGMIPSAAFAQDASAAEGSENPSRGGVNVSELLVDGASNLLEWKSLVPMRSNDGISLLSEDADVWDESVKEWTQGEGTEEDPYLIESCANLAYLAKQVNSGNSYDGVYFKLTKDLNLDDKPWTPIGSYYSYKFSGVFDGNFQHIEGLNCNLKPQSFSDVSQAALFGYTTNATLKNFTVAGSVVCTPGANAYYGYVAASGVVARAVGGVLENLGNFADVTTVTEGGNNSLNPGYGVCGGVVGNAYYTKIKNCFNAGAITSQNGYGVGGILGYSSGEYSYYPNPAENFCVENCYNVGAVVGNKAVGGIVGYANTNNSSRNYYLVSHCANLGTITAGTSNSRGGIVGLQSSYSGATSSYYPSNVWLKTTADCKVGSTGSGTALTDGSVDDTAALIKAVSDWNVLDEEGNPLFTTVDGQLKLAWEVGDSQQAPKIDISECIATASESAFTYTGKAFEGVTLTVTKDGEALDPNVYDVKYYRDFECTQEVAAADMVDAGTYYAVAVGVEVLDHTGRTSPVEVTISPASIACYSLTLSQDSFIYSATPVSPEATLTDDAGAPVDASAYAIAWYADRACTQTIEAPSAPGEYYVAAEALSGNYADKTVEPAKIVISKRNIEGALVELVTDTYSHTGEAVTPEVISVSIDGLQLTPEDYVVSYENNTGIGTAKAIVTAAPDSPFMGIAYTTFSIEAVEDPGTSIDSFDDLDGSGTAEDPYLIQSRNQFLSFGRLVNEGAPTAGVYFKCLVDINLNEVTDYAPVGYWAHPFSGHFDGDGHVFKLNMQPAGERTWYDNQYSTVGLFGMVKGTVLERAVIENVVTSGSISAPNFYDVGGIAGMAFFTDFRHCENGADILAGGSVGGIVGEAGADADNTDPKNIKTKAGHVIIESCVNTGDITAQENNETNTKEHGETAGGIVGMITGPWEGNAYNAGCSQIIGCYNTGAVTADTQVGGIAGIVRAKFSEENDFTGAAPASSLTPLSASATQGIKVTSCFNLGKVTATGDSSYGKQPQGALFGDDGSGEITGVTVQRCYWLQGTNAYMMYGLDQPEVDSLTSSKTAQEIADAGFIEALSYADYVRGANHPWLYWQVGDTAAVIDGQPESVFCDLGGSVTLRVNAQLPQTVPGSAGELSYQWYSCTKDGRQAEAIEGATQAEYAPATDEVGTFHYFCIVTNTYPGGQSDVKSAVTQVDVLENIAAAIPQVLVTADETSVQQMDWVKLSATVSNEDASGMGDLAYQWYVGVTDDFADAQPIEGAETANIEVLAEALGSAHYFCEVTNTFQSFKQESAVSPALRIDASQISITSPAQLKNIADNVNLYGVTYDGIDIYLDDDLDMASVGNWDPIGFYGDHLDLSHVFMGNFHGNRHAINNFTCDQDTGAALFGCVNGALIEDLVVRGNVSGNQNCAGVVSRVIDGSFAIGEEIDMSTTTIRNVGFEGSVVVEGTSFEGIPLGGAAGIVYYAHAHTLVQNCYNRADIVCGGNAAAGIIGGGHTDILVENCYNWGNVTGNNIVGGIAAMTFDGDFTIDNCYNAGAVTMLDDSEVSHREIGAISARAARADRASYYLEGTANSAYGSAGTGQAGVTPIRVSYEELGSEAFASRLAGNESVNGGLPFVANQVTGMYPRLWWEDQTDESYLQLQESYVTWADANTEGGFVYSGEAFKPGVVVTAQTSEGPVPLVEGRDYSVIYGTNVNAGEGAVYVRGMGSYMGIITKKFTIAPKAIPTDSVSIDTADAVYTGREQTRSVTVSIDGATLVNGVDYQISYSDNLNVGTARATVTGTGNYTGTFISTFRITPAQLSSAQFEQIATQIYTGQPLMPKPVLIMNGRQLVEGVDYHIAAYDNNIEVGNASITLVGDGNFEGDRTVNFQIAVKENVKLTLAEATLTGGPFTVANLSALSVDVRNNAGDVLVEGVDYQIEYQDAAGNVLESIEMPGSYLMVIQGIGEYADSTPITRVLTVDSKPIADSTVSIAPIVDQTLNGAPAAPTLVITDRESGKQLVLGTDYDAIYSSNEAPGTATVVIIGMGAYEGVTTATFRIVDSTPGGSVGGGGTAGETPGAVPGAPGTGGEIIADDDNPLAGVNDVSMAQIGLSSTSLVYNGSAQTPAITVAFGEEVLEEGKDYTVEVTQGGTEVGPATLTVTGIGDFTGTGTVSYTINHLVTATTFADLDSRSWYMDAAGGTLGGTGTLYLDYVLAKGLMTGYADVDANGVGTGTYTFFGPEDSITRGQVALVFYRLAGSPAANGAGTFTDVDYARYDGAAIKWAQANGIITGYADTDAQGNLTGTYSTFGPDDPITREQIAAIIKRFCVDFMKKDALSGSIDGFADAAKVSSYAVDAMRYCNSAGILTGSDGSLNPQHATTRAQMAKMLAVMGHDVLMH